MFALLHTISAATVKILAKGAMLLSHLQESVANARADRARVEHELFHGRYHLSSKSDDDLPLVR